MAQTGYTPILIYSSSTAAAAPAAGSLTNSTLGSELAINITDGKLFYKDNANAVQVIGWKVVPTTAGGTGLTSYTAGDITYYASGTALTKLAIGPAYQALQVNAGGTAPSWQPSATSVLTAQGDLLYASAANTLARLAKNTTATRYLANTGTTNNPQWDQVNLANGVTGTLPTGNGGTGLTSFTTNGIVYASSTSALATGSALSFDGTNFSTTGSATASRFIPSGSTVPTNGMYLPAANTVAISTNSSEDIRFFSTGGVSIGDTTDPGAGNLRLGTGNLVIGTAGKGIDFSVNSHVPGMTNELLNWYEEGGWTPTVRGSGTAGTYQIVSGSTKTTYVRVGGIVHLQAYIVLASSITGGGTGDLIITGIPWPKGDNTAAWGSVAFSDVNIGNNTKNLACYFGGTGISSTIYFWETNDALAVTLTPISGVVAGALIAFSITYRP